MAAHAQAPPQSEDIERILIVGDDLLHWIQIIEEFRKAEFCKAL
jgi:hypothetical protein